jgi:hypothetical protein
MIRFDDFNQKTKELLESYNPISICYIKIIQEVRVKFIQTKAS